MPKCVVSHLWTTDFGTRLKEESILQIVPEISELVKDCLLMESCVRAAIFTSSLVGKYLPEVQHLFTAILA